MIFPNIVIIFAILVIFNKQQNNSFKRSLQCYQQVGFVFLNRLVYCLLNLKQYLISYHFYFILFFYFTVGPASRSAQAGSQAGHMPEPTGLLAGPDRAPGRAIV